MWCDLEYPIIIAFLNITRSLEYVRCFLVLEVRRSVLKAMLVETFEKFDIGEAKNFLVRLGFLQTFWLAIIYGFLCINLTPDHPKIQKTID